MWAAKAGVILLGGDQPPYLFEAAPLAFALALLALGARLAGRGGWWRAPGASSRSPWSPRRRRT